MKTLLWGIFLFALAVLLTLASQANIGYAILIFPPYAAEVSLNAFIIGAVALFLLGYGLLRLINWALALPGKVATYQATRRQEEARSALFEGLLAYFEGRFSKTEQLASQVLLREVQPQVRAIAALLGASAADAARNVGKRDQYLARAELTAPDTQLARLMTQANALLKEHRYTEALDTLTNAKSLAPKLTTALKLELAVRQHLGQHGLVLPLIEQLEKSEALPAEQARQLRRQAWLAQLENDVNDTSQFKPYWHRLSSEARLDARLVLAASKKLRQWEKWRESRDVLIHALEGNWDNTLVLEFARLPAPPSNATAGNDTLVDERRARLSRAEEWLPLHATDASLLLALGRLCQQQALWGKARSYLEASLSVGPSAIAHIELARLLTFLGETETAQRHFESAAEAVETALAEG